MNVVKKIFFLITFSINLFASLDFTSPALTPVGTPNLALGAPSSTQKIITNTSGQYVYAIWSKSDGITERIQVAISSDYGDHWTDPDSTQVGTPNLSQERTGVSDGYAFAPQIVSDDSGQHVYAIWARSNGTNYIVQTAYSDDHGLNWGHVIDLNDIGQTGYNSGLKPQISTDISGQHVYALWTKNLLISQSVEFAYSDDFGHTWTNILLSNADSPYEPKLATNSTGQYVYAIWVDDNSSNDDLKSAYSNDFGQSWIPGPNLVTNNSYLSDFKLICSDSGQYVYAIWSAKDGTIHRAQVGISSNYGVSWTSPSFTPASDGPPNLSQPQAGSIDGSAGSLGITTNGSGQKVYAIWSRYDGVVGRVQVAISSDYGNTWINPKTTTAVDGYPNLSEPRLGTSDGYSYYCQIATDSSGNNVYAIWTRNNGLYSPTQLAVSTDSGITWIDPTTTHIGTTSPDLSLGSAYFTGVSTNFSGEYVYTIWNSSGNVQIANGLFVLPIKKIAFPISLMPIK